MASETPSGRPIIVVGVDGSEGSRDALRWAANYAALTAASLQAVMVWHVPLAAHGAVIPAQMHHELEEDSRRALAQVIAETLPGHPSPVSETVVKGHPATELLKAAATAELLVVGGRGHGAFTGMLVGSVSERCVAHAPCPVVVVRHSALPA